jgi:hypothetical protein
MQQSPNKPAQTFCERLGVASLASPFDPVAHPSIMAATIRRHIKRGGYDARTATFSGPSEISVIPCRS